MNRRTFIGTSVRNPRSRASRLGGGHATSHDRVGVQLYNVRTS